MKALIMILTFTNVIRAENFKILDIEIIAWSSLFLNIETNLILYFYPEKCINSTNQSCVYEADKFKILRAIWNYIQKQEGL